MCSNVILPASLVGIFEALLSSAATTINEDVGNPSWQSRADFYITSILSSLPWGGAELVEVSCVWSILVWCKRGVGRLYLTGQLHQDVKSLVLVNSIKFVMESV